MNALPSFEERLAIARVCRVPHPATITAQELVRGAKRRLKRKRLQARARAEAKLKAARIAAARGRKEAAVRAQQDRKDTWAAKREAAAQVRREREDARAAARLDAEQHWQERLEARRAKGRARYAAKPDTIARRAVKEARKDTKRERLRLYYRAWRAAKKAAA